MKKVFVLTLVLGILISGCVEEKSTSSWETPGTETSGNSVNAKDINSTDTYLYTNSTHSAPVITVTQETKYDRFVSWLKTDETNKHPYILDNSKTYSEQYICSQFTRDFITNATNAGFEVYAVGLTGAVKGQDDWHMMAAVVLDNDWYFVDPQTDVILKKEAMFNAYGYEYAYFGKEVSIGRNDAEISTPVNYHPVIGLNGQNFLYLK